MALFAPKQLIPATVVPIFGGGIAALSAGYLTQKFANASQRKMHVMVMTDKIDAPSSAGTHIVIESPGVYGRNDKSIKDLALRLNRGYSDLYDAVLDNKIECRSHTGYEVLGRNAQELEALSDEILRLDEEATIQPISDQPRMRVHGYPHSMMLVNAGQINAPELLQGLADAIKKMGGEIHLNTLYQRQESAKREGRRIITSRGEFNTAQKPLMATGALHQRSLSDFPFDTHIEWTGAMIYGPLSVEDRKAYSNTKSLVHTACDVNVAGDVLWMSIDPKGYLVIGRGAMPDDSAWSREKLAHDLSVLAEQLLPGLTRRYPNPEFIFKPIHFTNNHLPLVARLKNYDLIGAFSGVGFVPAFAIARDYAYYRLNRQGKGLKFWEKFQPKNSALSLFKH